MRRDMVMIRASHLLQQHSPAAAAAAAAAIARASHLLQHSPAAAAAAIAPPPYHPSSSHPTHSFLLLHPLQAQPAASPTLHGRVSFEHHHHHHILKENPNLRAHWSKFQRFLNEGVTESDIKKSLKLHPHPLSRISDEKLDSILRLLNGVGMSGRSLGRVLLTYSQLFRFSAQNLEAKIRLFESFGIARTKFKGPFVLPFVARLSVKSLADRIQCLLDIGISREAIAKIVSRNPRVFHLSMEGKVKPTIAYLKECGMDGKPLSSCLSSCSQILGYGNLARSKRIQFFRQLGLEEKSFGTARAFVLLSSVSLVYLQKRVDFFRSRGFSSSDIALMVAKFPSILCLSEENLSKKIVYVQNVLKRDIRELVKYPIFFGFNLDKRIIRRFSALAECKEVSNHMIHYSLATVVKHSEANFQKLLLRAASTNRER